MTTYRTVKGYNIKKVSSDPANVKEGQIWYNSSTSQIKIAPLIGAWASGGNMVAARNGHAGFGNQTDAVCAGGFIATPAPADDDAQALVEEYNGSSWSEVTNMPTNRSSASGCGASQTSGMVTGGIHTNQTTSVEYDGTNWTDGGDIPAVTRMSAQCGTVTASLRCGGAGNPGTAINQTIEYDGTNWTSGGNLPHIEYGHMIVGTQTAAVFAGGHNGPTHDNLYEYDGSSWTDSGVTLTTNSGTNNMAAAANGTQTAALWAAALAPARVSTQVYDGSAISVAADLGTARYNVNNGGGGTSVAAIVAGGYTGTASTAVTEEFTEAVTTRTVDVS